MGGELLLLGLVEVSLLRWVEVLVLEWKWQQCCLPLVEPEPAEAAVEASAALVGASLLVTGLHGVCIVPC